MKLILQRRMLMNGALTGTLSVEQCADKANRILDILYQDFAIDSCSDCCYKADCDKLRKNNNDVTICDVLDLMQK